MRRIQFSLTTLLILPLALSPILIAVREVRNIAFNHKRELGAATVLLGFLYVVILTAIDSSRRLPANNRPMLRAAIWGGFRGGLYGLLYYFLIFLPLAAADQYYFYWDLPWPDRGLLFAVSLLFTFLIGLATGIPIGVAIGLLLAMIRRRRANISRQTADFTDS
jgi:hypothetical protein